MAHSCNAMCRNMDKYRELIMNLEVAIEKQELLLLGLSQEEIDGYLEFFIDNYIEVQSLISLS